jgi:NAD(P)-dependent dehydrogenase (short-subunit alcohol dehydrogenase family)
MTISESRALAGKVAIITGAATGIGRASALLFARPGARVALVDVRGPELERTSADVRSTGGKVASTLADLARPDDCATAVAVAVRAFGRLDVLLNNISGAHIVVDGGAMAGGA